MMATKHPSRAVIKIQTLLPTAPRQPKMNEERKRNARLRNHNKLQHYKTHSFSTHSTRLTRHTKNVAARSPRRPPKTPWMHWMSHPLRGFHPLQPRLHASHATANGYLLTLATKQPQSALCPKPSGMTALLQTRAMLPKCPTLWTLPNPVPGLPLPVMVMSLRDHNQTGHDDRRDCHRRRKSRRRKKPVAVCERQPRNDGKHNAFLCTFSSFLFCNICFCTIIGYNFFF